MSRATQHTRRYRLMLYGCVWLMGSWGLSLQASSIHLAARQTMPFAALFGLMILWPLWRLSQSPAQNTEDAPSTSTVSIFLEWLFLNLILQAVIWPLKFNAGWTWEQTAWLDLALASWSLVTGGLLAVGGRLAGGWGRSFTMAMCLALLLGEHLVLIWWHPWGLTQRENPGTLPISPLTVIYHISQAPELMHAKAYTLQVLTMAIIAPAIWFQLILITWWWRAHPKSYKIT